MIIKTILIIGALIIGFFALKFLTGTAKMLVKATLAILIIGIILNLLGIIEPQPIGAAIKNIINTLP